MEVRRFRTQAARLSEQCAASVRQFHARLPSTCARGHSRPCSLGCVSLSLRESSFRKQERGRLRFGTAAVVITLIVPEYLPAGSTSLSVLPAKPNTLGDSGTVARRSTGSFLAPHLVAALQTSPKFNVRFGRELTSSAASTRGSSQSEAAQGPSRERSRNSSSSESTCAGCSCCTQCPAWGARCTPSQRAQASVCKRSKAPGLWKMPQSAAPAM